jgi:hypothetical protein
MDAEGKVLAPCGGILGQVPRWKAASFAAKGEAVSMLFFGPGEDRPVRRPEDVRDYLPDDRKYHYRPGYSMAEAARCWVAAQPDLPASVASVIGSPVLSRAHFEYPTTVWGGGIAMADVMAFIPGSVIAIEAKVNETFDRLVADWIEAEGRTNPNSPPHRRRTAVRYAEALGVPGEALAGIRYQLLQRTLGAALTARAAGLPAAWMVVQDLTYGRPGNHAANRADFDRFVALVGPAPVLEGVPVRLGWADDAAPPGS